jgi:hypothetical protein
VSSLERRKDASPAYWVNAFGVFREVAMPGHRPLYWAKTPLPVVRLAELWEEAESHPKRFARLIEKEHGIQKDDTPQDNHM